MKGTTSDDHNPCQQYMQGQLARRILPGCKKGNLCGGHNNHHASMGLHIALVLCYANGFPIPLSLQAIISRQISNWRVIALCRSIPQGMLLMSMVLLACITLI